MGFFDAIRASVFGPTPPPQPETVIRNTAIPRKRAIEAGEVTRLNASWTVGNHPADEEVRRSLERVRARSRDLAYNNEYARKYLQMVATHIVGPAGFTLQALAADGRTPDRLARDSIEAAFDRWSRRGVCETSGRFSFPELCRIAIETAARDGEALFVKRRDRSNPFGYSLRIVEVDRLPVSHNVTLKGGVKVVMGIEIDADGKAVAYWLNFGDLDNASTAASTLTRVPAEDVIHVYRPGRPEQHRALPWMHPVMTGLKMLAGFEESSLVAARVGASKMGFFSSPDGSAEPLADDQVDGEFYTDAEPGAFSVLPPGYRFESWNPDYPHQNYESFVKARLRSIASGLGIAYHTLANDLADVNFSSARAGTLEERDNWIVLQNWFIDCFLRPVYLDWLDAALAAGAIVMPMGSALPAAKRDKWAEHSWQGRRWQWVDPLKDIEAARLAIKTGIASPQMIAAQNGIDIDDVLQQTAAFEDAVEQAGVSLIDYDLSETPEEPEPAAAPDNAMRDLAIAALTRSMTAEPARAPDVHIHQAPINVATPEVRIDNHIAAAEAPIAHIVNEIHERESVPPTIVVHPSEVRVDVAAPEVTVEVEAVMPEQKTPTVVVELPARRTETNIIRDASGNIARAEQIETTLQ